jgi:tetratricopeptide (TPR) repeat protein
MWRQFTLIVALKLAISCTAGADEPKPATEIPQWQRRLQGEDAKAAIELEFKIGDQEAANDYPGAIRSAEELLALRKRVQGVEHWESVDATWMLDEKRKVAALSPERRANWRKAVNGMIEAQQLMEKAEDLRAQPLFQEYCRRCEQFFGPRHTLTAHSYNELAANLQRLGRHADAQPLFLKALALRRELLGEKHPRTAWSYKNLASNLGDLGKYAEAQQLFQKALDLHRELWRDSS